MSNILLLAQQIAQSSTTTAARGAPPGPPPGFSFVEMIRQLLQFVGFFLSIGAVGFRYGIVRRIRGMSKEARTILEADNAARFGLWGIIFLLLSFLGVPYLQAASTNHTLTELLPKNLAPLKFKLGALGVSLVGFLVVRAKKPTIGWILAAVGILIATLQPLYTGKLAGKINAVHILAASTWLGTLLVLSAIGIRGVIRNGEPGTPRARLVADLVNSFSPLALTAATVVALTGATTAWLHLKRISSLWTTNYGITLIVKLVLVLIVVLLGAWNWKKVRPSLGKDGSEQTIKRSSTMELSFAALVLIVTSVLVTLPSPK
ncbi:MAG TPA: CopD family protein [Gemmatimonadaceae bacterium]|nr:CopD family protein [Gemmatimonadaceae bacterium]